MSLFSFASLQGFQDSIRFFIRTSLMAFWLPYPGDIIAHLYRLLVNTLPVVGVLSLASGAMLTVQAAASLALVGGGPYSGTLVGLGGVREVFPILAATAVAARSGAQYASTIGSMRISQQIDALELMGINSARMLISPRIVATAIGTPICILVADLVGVWGSYLVGILQLNIDPGDMWNHLASSIRLRDIVIGSGKGFLLGWLIALISSREGWFVSGGPKGLGQATNRAVVRSLIAVCIASLVVTYLFYGTTVIQ